MNAKSSSGELIKGWTRNFWPLLIPLSIIIFGISGFPYASTNAIFSDITISHYPNALFLKRALTLNGAVPLWSPTILGGYPFAANPLAGLWYPPGWLALIFPLPLGFNITVILHLLWGGLGMYTLLKRERLSHPAALFGALAFESMPKIYAHYGAGHLTLVYAIAWTPWLLITTYQQEGKSRWRKLLSPAIILALIFLADPRWVVYAGMIWLAYTSVNWKENRKKFPSFVSHVFSQSILAALLAAPLALPLIEYTRLSTRKLLTASDVLSKSLPPFRLLGILFPDFGGYHEWILYPGAIVLVLGIAAMLVFDRRGRFIFWITVIFFSLLFSLGDYVPGMTVLAQLPGFNLLRVPPRVLFISGMAWAAAAAYGLDILLNDQRNLPLKRIRLALVGLFMFVFILTLGIGVLSGQWEKNYLWGICLIFAASLGVFLLLDKRISPVIMITLLFGISLFDWGQTNASLLTFRDKANVLSEGASGIQFIAKQKGNFRVYSPSYSLPQQTTALYGLSLADGVDPLQLESYVDFMEEATGVPRQGYSVTLPPFGNGDVDRDNANYRPDATLLGLLNVRYLISAFDLAVDGLVLREKFDQTRIYENLKAAPRAWVQIGDNIVSEAEVEHWEPNRIILNATGPGLLVLSEITYPGWQVAVDQEKDKIEGYKELLRAVQLPPGNQVITFNFKPLSIYYGLSGFIIGVIAMFFLFFKDKKTK